MALRNAAGTVLTRAQVLAATAPVNPDTEVTVNEDIFEDTETDQGGVSGGQKLRWRAGTVVKQSEIDEEYPLPTVTGVAPAGGPIAGGTAITITGTGFARGYELVHAGGDEPITGHNVTVSIGGAACTNVKVEDDETITCTTAAVAAAGPSDVVVTTQAGTVTDAGAFAYA